MSVIFFLIIIGIVVAGGFLAAFIWSVKSGQYDDSYTPSVRMLFDNHISSTEASANNVSHNAEDGSTINKEIKPDQTKNQK
jgi:cbb3-type cytochrome oxidase maturation protein